MASSSSSRRADRVAARGDRRRLPGAARQVGQEAPQLIERVVLVGRLVVDRAGARLRAGAAELLLVGRLAHGRGDDRRPGDEELGAAAHDDAEVAEDDARGAEPRAWPERGGDDRDAREVLDHQVEARQRRDVGEAHGLERLDAAPAAGAVDQAHERDAQLVGGALGPHHLLPDGGVGRPAADGEVVGLDHRAAPVDAALADDRVGRQEARQLARAVVLALARDARRSRGSCRRSSRRSTRSRTVSLPAACWRATRSGPPIWRASSSRRRSSSSSGCHVIATEFAGRPGRWDHQAMTVGRSAAAVLVALSVTAAMGCGGAQQRHDRRRRPVANDPGPTPPVRRPRAAARRARRGRPGRRRPRRAASSTTGSRRCAAATSSARRTTSRCRASSRTPRPVLTVHTEQERIAVNMSLSCGAVATEMGGAGVVHDRHLPAHRAPGRQLRHAASAARRAAPSASSGARSRSGTACPTSRARAAGAAGAVGTRGVSVVAALYDVHGNLPALDAVLADAAFARADAVVVGGDVAAGPLPAEVLDRLAGLDLPRPLGARQRRPRGRRALRPRRHRPLGLRRRRSRRARRCLHRRRASPRGTAT